ncbi:hypothetical protein K144316041_20630 [Clostridium tetani]|nr:hypothetical protein [Clostridium tetani]BDR73355.1 hypothetical protein K144316041_20630 [Clostridium tetani]
MKKFKITVSQNGWEYEGYTCITCCENVEKIDDRTVLIDKTIKLEFDEEISDEVIELE